MGIQLFESYGQPSYQHSALHTPCQERSIEENSDFDKIIEVVEWWHKKLKDSRSHQNFNLHDLYSICQLPSQQEKPIDLDKSMEAYIQ